VYLAAFCQNTGFCPASALNIDPYSIAVTQLRPDSMQDINNLTLHPLPTPVRYTSIIGTGKWTYDPSGGWQDGDGVVTAVSQNLRNVTGTDNLRHTAISVTIATNGQYCDAVETHKCEPTDSVVWTKLLQEVQVSSCNYYASGAPVPAGYGVPWNVFSAQRELLLKTYCSPKNTDIVIGNNSPQVIVYHWGYQWNGTQWSQFKLQCAGQELSTDWCAGEASGEIATSSPWYLGLTCTSTGSQWKCGCRDAACTQSYWELQGVKK